MAASHPYHWYRQHYYRRHCVCRSIALVPPAVESIAMGNFSCGAIPSYCLALAVIAVSAHLVSLLKFVIVVILRVAYSIKKSFQLTRLSSRPYITHRHRHRTAPPLPDATLNAASKYSWAAPIRRRDTRHATTSSGPTGTRVSSVSVRQYRH
jgi:hypothetical protein